MLWIIIGAIILFNVAFAIGMYINGALRDNDYGGTMVAQKHPDGKLVYTLVIDGDLDQLQYKESVLLRIAHVASGKDLYADSLVRE